MTNESPEEMSSFVASVIGVGIALLIMPQIIMGSVGAQQKGVARTAANDLVEDINTVCGDSSEESGSIDIQSGYEIELNYRDFTLKDPEGKTIEERTMACKVDTGTTVTSSWSDYKVQSEQNNDGEDLYDLSQS